MRLVPVDEESHYVMSPENAMKYVDENTIGVFVSKCWSAAVRRQKFQSEASPADTIFVISVLGSTYTGHYEDVEGMCKALDEYEARTGNFVPVHVDAASGGFVAPFGSPSLKWDFRNPRVVSINTSGHKFGQAYVGVGIVVWRDSKHRKPLT